MQASVYVAIFDSAYLKVRSWEPLEDYRTSFCWMNSDGTGWSFFPPARVRWKCHSRFLQPQSSWWFRDSRFRGDSVTIISVLIIVELYLVRYVCRRFYKLGLALGWGSACSSAALVFHDRRGPVWPTISEFYLKAGQHQYDQEEMRITRAQSVVQALWASFFGTIPIFVEDSSITAAVRTWALSKWPAEMFLSIEGYSVVIEVIWEVSTFLCSYRLKPVPIHRYWLCGTDGTASKERFHFYSCNKELFCACAFFICYVWLNKIEVLLYVNFYIFTCNFVEVGSVPGLTFVASLGGSRVEVSNLSRQPMHWLHVDEDS